MESSSSDVPFWHSKKFWCACLTLILLSPGIYVGSDVLRLAVLLEFGFISTLYLGGQGALDYYLRIAQVIKPSVDLSLGKQESIHTQVEES
jgi:hypothetical protein